LHGYDLNGADGWWMLAMMATVVVAIVVSVWLIVHRPGAGGMAHSGAQEILRERFARGEITAEQFDEAKKKVEAPWVVDFQSSPRPSVLR
jgi:uncharacterized membrane protein